MNRPFQLCYPVSTLNGKELLPAGTLLTSDTMERLTSLARTKTFTTLPLLAHGTIATDIDRVFKNPPYNQIFSDKKRKKEVFDNIHRVELVEPLLKIYDYFKAHDPYTYRHILTVFTLSLLLAQELIENRSELDREIMAAPNHDLGKICVPTSVLKKSSPLSEKEQQHLSHHVAAGYVLLSYYLQDPNHPAAITARDHHERRDGSGYPSGIKLKNKTVEIVGVSDVFDALITRRPYRAKSYSVRGALETLTLQANEGILSEEVVHTLIRLNRKDKSNIEKVQISNELRSDPPVGNQYSGAKICKFNIDEKK